MRYIVSGEFTKIDETSGTIQNTSKINVVEVSDTNEKGSGIMLYPLDRFTFSKSIYARCVDGGGAEVRVVPFEVGTQGGGEQGTTPSGGGSGIAFAGMILGTESSTVDGGLWYGVTDGLPVVKMNYGGGDFLIDTRFDGDALVDDVLFLSGHKFQLTGFADDLAFSDNNFYVGGDSTPIGSVSNFAFQFTDAAALSVAEGDIISITQLDTNAVDYSLNLPDTAFHWAFNQRLNSIYTYFTSTDASYLRTGDAAYISKKPTARYKFDLTMAKYTTALKPTGATLPNLGKSTATFTAESFAHIVTVKEIYDASGNLTRFDITINSDAALKNNDTWINKVTATASAVDSTATSPNTVTTQILLADDVAKGYKDVKNEEGSLTPNGDGTYTFKTDTYVAGYKKVTENGNEYYKLQDDLPDGHIHGDYCTIDGLADGLIAIRNDPYKYTLYKKNDDTNHDYANDTVLGTISFGDITITNKAAFKTFDTSKAGVIATLKDDQKGGEKDANDNDRAYLGYRLLIGGDLANPTDTLESFVKQTTDNTTGTGTYKYFTGTKAERFTASTPENIPGDYTYENSISYTPEETLGVEGLDVTISGLNANRGDTFIIKENGEIYNADSTIKLGKITQTNGKTAATGVITLEDAIYPSASSRTNGSKVTLTGFNGYVLSVSIGQGGFHESYVEYGPTTFNIGANTYWVGYALSDDKKTATYYKGVSYKIVNLTFPTGYMPYPRNNSTVIFWAPYISNTDYNALSDEEKQAYFTWAVSGAHILRDSESYIKFCEFNGQDWVFNSHAFDGVTTSDTITIPDVVRSTPINFNIEFATDADTLAVSRTFANETFTEGATAGTYTYTATGSTAGWNVSADGTKIASWEFNGKTFTIENLRTDLGTIGFDSKGYIHATNGSTIGRMGGNVIKLYDTAVHKLATPILSGADAADFTLILPS